jgi:hypothetical protein
VLLLLGFDDFPLAHYGSLAQLAEYLVLIKYSKVWFLLGSLIPIKKFPFKNLIADGGKDFFLGETLIKKG